MGLRGEIPRLAALISIIARYHPRGLRVILGEDLEPTAEDIDEILNGIADKKDLGVFIDQGRPSEEALNKICRVEPVLDLIAKAGGWEKIVAAAREVKQREPLAWGIFADCVLWLGVGSYFNVEPNQVRIASKHGVSVYAVKRWKNGIPELIARRALKE